MLSGIHGRASPRLLCFSKGHFCGQPPAIVSKAGRFEDVALARFGPKGESELVGPDEISPVAIVLSSVGKVEPVDSGLIRVGYFAVRPYSDPFSLRLGGPQNVVIQLEAEFGGELYLGAGGIEQADIGVKLWLAAAIAFKSRQGQNVYFLRGIINAERRVRVVPCRRKRFSRGGRLATRLEHNQEDE